MHRPIQQSEQCLESLIVLDDLTGEDLRYPLFGKLYFDLRLVGSVLTNAHTHDKMMISGGVFNLFSVFI